MASITIPKFFKQAEITSGHTTADGLDAIIGSNPQWTGIGITWAGNDITGMTAFGKSIDFTTLGGGTITSFFSPSIGNLKYVKPNGHQDQVLIGWAQNTYATIQTYQPSTGQSPVDTINSIVLGLKMATLNGTSTDVNTDGLMDGTRTKNLINGIIGTLDVTEYAQGAIDTTTTTGQTTITIKGIQENDGKISAGSSTVDTNIVVDGTYNASTNKIATQSTVSTAIGNLHSFAITLGTGGTTTTYAPQTANATLTIPTYAGNTIGLVPAKSSTTAASTGKYLSEAGSWESIPAEKLYTIEAGSVSSNVIALNLKKDGTAVANTINFGVANQDSTDTTYGLYISGSGNAVNYGLNTATSAALGKANTALQPVTAVSATDMFSTSTDADGDITVTAKSYAQATTAQSTVAAGTESFTVGNGKLGLVIDNTTLNTFGANATSDVTYDIVTTHTTVTGGGSRPNTPSATDAYQPTNTAANFNPLATQSYVDAKMGDLANALVYKGTVDTNHPLPSSGQKTGDVYVVAENGTYAEKACEVGDMLIWNGSTWDAVSGENQVTNNAAVLTAEISSASTPTQTTIATVDGTNITVGVKHYDVTPGADVTAPTTTTAPASQNYVCGITMDDDGHVTATSYANPFDWEQVTLS